MSRKDNKVKEGKTTEQKTLEETVVNEKANTGKPAEEVSEEVSEEIENTEETNKKDSTDKKDKAIEKDVLAKKVEELTDKLAKEKDDYVRLMAEFETFRRRNAEEKLNLVNSAGADTIKGLLPVLDDCERAMEILKASSDDAAKEGTSLIYNKLMDYLKTRGLQPINAKGEKFDTDFHEAVTQFPAPSDDMKGYVLDVVQTGYTLNGKVLRYAKVVVGA